MPRASGSVYGVRLPCQYSLTIEPVGARRDVGDPLVEDVVGADVALLGLAEGRVAEEVVLEPLEHRAGRDLPALDRVLAGDDGVGVGAEEALAADLLVALADEHVRGAR